MFPAVVISPAKVASVTPVKLPAISTPAVVTLRRLVPPTPTLKSSSVPNPK